VAPFSLSVPKGEQWYLVYRDARRDQRDFVAFRQWLMSATQPRPARRRNAGS
jgi:LysR family glycine cleavage system transcriptional activator